MNDCMALPQFGVAALDEQELLEMGSGLLGWKLEVLVWAARQINIDEFVHGFVDGWNGKPL